MLPDPKDPLEHRDQKAIQAHLEPQGVKVQREVLAVRDPRETQGRRARLARKALQGQLVHRDPQVLLDRLAPLPSVRIQATRQCLVLTA